jgi:WD40 repeat protein
VPVPPRRFGVVVIAAGLGLIAAARAADPPAPVRPAVDLQGDPLPDGAIARLGSIRFRQGANVDRVLVSADGKRILSAARSYELWDGDTGRLIPKCRELESNPDGAWYAFAPVADNVLAVATSTKRQIRVLDWQSGKALVEAPAPEQDALGVAVSPDGKTLYAARSYQHPDRMTTRLWKWDGDHRKWIDVLEFPGGAREKMYRFSADGRTVAISRYDFGVEVWDLPAAKRLLGLPARDLATEAFALSADGKLLAREDHAARAVRVYDVATGKERPRLPDQPTQLGQALAFSPDGKILAAVDRPGHIRLWDLAGGKKLRDIRGHDLHVRDLAFADRGKRLVAADGDGVTVFDPATGKGLVDYGGHTYAVSAVAWSPDGRRIASGAAYTDAVGRVWDAGTGQKAFELRGHESGIEPTAYSPDGRTIATGCLDGTVKLWDADGGKELHTFAAKDGMVYGMAFSPDGRWLVSGTGRALRVWDVAGRKETRTLPYSGVGAAGVTFTPDGRSLLVRDRISGLRLVDFATGKDLIQYAWAGALLNGVAVSPDGRRMATGSEDGTVVVREIATGRELGALIPPETGRTRVTSVAYAPDGRTVAAALGDGEVVVCEVATATERFRFRKHLGATLKVAYSPDASRLASAGSDRTLLVWDLTGARGLSLPLPQDANAAWADLADGAAARGLAAIRYLATHPDAAVPLIAAAVKPIPPTSAAAVDRLIEQLDSPRFAEREKATTALAELDEAAGGKLRDAARRPASAEVRERLTGLLAKLDDLNLTGDRLRVDRAVEALERIETPAARKVLEALAGGASGARVTVDASGALKRLAARR